MSSAWLIAPNSSESVMMWDVMLLDRFMGTAVT